MIITTPQPRGFYKHLCDRCGDARVVPFPSLRWPCKCQEFATTGPSRRPTLTPEQQAARERREQERRAKRVADKQRLETPCVFLGAATGKKHKVGCVNKFLPEHKCLSGERLPFVKPYRKKRNGATGRVIEPVAIPGGRCRDLAAAWGEVSCLDCPLYRAALLPAPPAE